VHQTKEDIPKGWITIDATAPLAASLPHPEPSG
jgi:hypothetical protein